MIELEEVPIDSKICSRCGLPVQYQRSSNSCSCNTPQREERRIPEPADSDSWSDIT